MQTPHGKLSVIFTDPPILLTCSVISESPLCFDRSADDRVSASAVPLSFIPREVFGRKQQEVEKKIAELEQQMMQYGDVKPATEADVSGKLENLQRLMEQPPVPEDGEFSEEDIDKYVFGVRVYEDRFEWLLNLSPEARGELDDAGSPVYFTKLTVTPDDERAWFKKHPQWSKSNKYAELEAWIFI